MCVSVSRTSVTVLPLRTAVHLCVYFAKAVQVKSFSISSIFIASCRPAFPACLLVNSDPGWPNEKRFVDDRQPGPRPIYFLT